MFLVKSIVVITCAKNRKRKFKLVKVIQEKVYSFFLTRCNLNNSKDVAQW